MPPPVASGLLWSTDSAIEFARTGAAVPAIPVARGAGPLYVVISYSQAATPGEDEPAIFYIGNPSDNLYTTNVFHVYRNWGTGIGVSTTPGRGVMVDLPAPPSDFVGEIWASAAGANMVSYLNSGWYMDPIPNHDPVATSHLFIGYKPDGANPAWRGAGTIHRMAIYDRVPTAAERAQLVEWVQSEDSGDPEISGALAASSSPAVASFSASVAWPGIAGSLTAAASPLTASVAASVAISSEATARSPAPEASFAAAVRVEAGAGAATPPVWAGVAASVGVRADLLASASRAAASIAAKAGTGARLQAETAPASFNASGQVRWPVVSGALSATAAPSRLNASAAVQASGNLLASTAPAFALFWAGAGWPPLRGRMEAAAPSATGAASAKVAAAGALAAHSLPASARFEASSVWSATLWAVVPESFARAAVSVRVAGRISAKTSPALASFSEAGYSPAMRFAFMELSRSGTFLDDRGDGELLTGGRRGGELMEVQ